MQFTFIHGWGFDARFWNALSLLLSSFEQQRIDLGFFNAVSPPFLREGLGVGQDVGHLPSNWKHDEGKQTPRPPPAPPASGRGDANDINNSILIGHSLGLVHGVNQYKNWKGWIAINSFPRFVATDTAAGCVSAAALRAMKKKLANDPQKTLTEFYSQIGATPPANVPPNVERLDDGLDALRDADIGNTLKHMNVPGLVLAARNDPLVPIATSEALASGHSLAWHETGGHILPQSDAPWCAKVITEFIKVNF